MTIKQYRETLVWSLSELARRSGLTYQTVSNVEHGKPVYFHTAAAVAKALTEGLGKTVTVADLEGVNIINP